MTDHAVCKCGTIVPPDKEKCELCGIKEQLAAVVERGKVLEAECARLRRQLARIEVSRP